MSAVMILSLASCDLTCALASDSTEDTAVRTIGSRRELFVGEWLIDRLAGVRLKLHHPVRREIVLRIDQPCEKAWTETPDLDPTPFGYSTVMKDGDVYRLYYSWDRTGDSPTGYAESRDGIHWQKPNLGLVEIRGSKAASQIIS